MDGGSYIGGGLPGGAVVNSVGTTGLLPRLARLLLAVGVGL